MNIDLRTALGIDEKNLRSVQAATAALRGALLPNESEFEIVEEKMRSARAAIASVHGVLFPLESEDDYQIRNKNLKEAITTFQQSWAKEYARLKSMLDKNTYRVLEATKVLYDYGSSQHLDQLTKTAGPLLR